MKPRLPRRLLLTAVIGLMAVVTVAGCRVEQGAAAFVGETRITDAQVDNVVDSLPVELVTNNLANVSSAYGGVRHQVLEALAVVELGRHVADDTGALPDADARSVARDGWMQQTGLPESNAFVSLMAEAEGYRALLQEGAEPQAPTDTDIEAAADNFTTATGQKLQSADLQQLTADLNSDQGRRLIGVNRQIAQYVADYDVTANPKYGQLSIVTFLNASGVPLLTVPVPN